MSTTPETIFGLPVYFDYHQDDESYVVFNGERYYFYGDEITLAHDIMEDSEDPCCGLFRATHMEGLSLTEVEALLQMARLCYFGAVVTVLTEHEVKGIAADLWEALQGADPEQVTIVTFKNHRTGTILHQITFTLCN